LRQGVELVDQKLILRSVIDNRLVHYVVPSAVAGDDDTRASHAPEFNEAISPAAILWPQVRARWDAERVCLVSAQRTTGWFHDLYFPGYLWADTADRWLVPGLRYHDGIASYDLGHDRLQAAMHELRRQESGPGQWGLGGTTMPFGEELQRLFPLVGRFLDEHGRPAFSQLSPEAVARTLAGVFD
jgi:hypothetical protein